MGQYYCGYCQSHLTHGSHSVIKSHLAGKNHIRNYFEFYEKIAVAHPELDPAHKPSSLIPPYEYSLDDQYRGMPGFEPKTRESKDFYNEDDDSIHPPPPPTSNSLPAPPPSVLHYDEQNEKGIVAEYIKTHPLPSRKPVYAPEDRYQRRNRPTRGRGGRPEGRGGRPEGRGFEGHGIEGRGGYGGYGGYGGRGGRGARGGRGGRGRYEGRSGRFGDRGGYGGPREYSERPYRQSFRPYDE
ncbi:DEKNAAC104299, partial [Brettanomyces naardenensis]